MKNILGGFQVYISVKGNKGKVLDVQSQIFNFISFFPRTFVSVNSFQKPNFCISLFTAKNLDLLILKDNLDHKL